MVDAPRPLCFVAMPFGRKTSPTAPDVTFDFDDVYQAYAAAIARAGLEARRADFDPSQGFIHRSMFEAILVAEYLVADVSFGNVNVAYELGLRHGASAGTTVMVCERSQTRALPFDLKPLRALTYTLGADGRLSADERAKLTDQLAEHLTRARNGDLPSDNPIMQVTQLRPAATGHEKTDVFLGRMRYASAIGERVAEALLLKGPEAIAALGTIEAELLGAKEVPQLHTGLISVFLGYREKKAYRAMIDLAAKMPAELAVTAVVKEQLALAHNRLAEAEAAAGNPAGADALRSRAIAIVEAIPAEHRTSETAGILGRIYKGRYDSERQAGSTAVANAALAKAIEVYEAGFELDPRDFYPGVNAVTLRIARATPEDEARLAALLPVVRFSVERAPRSKKAQEQYWQSATKLELAAAARDWPAAERHLGDMLLVGPEPWMKETSAKNLGIQRAARATEPATVHALDKLLAPLTT